MIHLFRSLYGSFRFLLYTEYMSRASKHHHKTVKYASFPVESVPVSSGHYKVKNRPAEQLRGTAFTDNGFAESNRQADRPREDPPAAH